MAKWRGGARTARQQHGAQFDSGYQYRRPQREEIVLGGWQRVWPFGKRDVPGDALQRLDDGILVDGVIYPLWQRTESQSSSGHVLAAVEHHLIDDVVHVVFIRRPDQKLLIRVLRANGVQEWVTDITVPTAHSPHGDNVATDVWGKRIYFSLYGSSTLYRFEPENGNVTVVPGALSGPWLFVLADHLFTITEENGIFMARWSVNGNPENWTGTGSGSLPVSARIGRVRGHAPMVDHMVLFGEHSAMRIMPSGTLPPFRFQNTAHIRGVAYRDAIVSLHGLIYFIDHARRLVVYDGNQTQRVGEGEAAFTQVPMLYGSRRIGRMFVGTGDDTLILDTTTRQWVGTNQHSWDFMADAPTEGEAGRMLGYRNTETGYDVTMFALDPEFLTQPYIQTGRHMLPEEVLVETVDLIRTNENAPRPLLTIHRQLQNGVMDTQTFGDESLVEDERTRLRYRVNAPATGFEIQMDFAAGIGNIGVGELITFYTEYAPERYRAEVNADGNFAVYPEANSIVYAGRNSVGNFNMWDITAELEAAAWRRDAGVEKIILTVQGIRRGEAIPA